MAKKRMVAVIGLGHVGAHVAYSLAVQGIADELLLWPARRRTCGMRWPTVPIA